MLQYSIAERPCSLLRGKLLLGINLPQLGGTWMVKGGEMGGFGDGSLEHPRHWLGPQWAGLFLGVPSCLEPQGAP